MKIEKKDFIADLHCHPSVKALLGMHPIQSVRAWQEYRFNLKFLGVGEIDEVFGDAIDSQSCLTQITRGNGRVIFWVIYPFEKEYVEKKELIKLATKAKGINQEMVNYFLEGDSQGNRFVRKNVSYFNILKDQELPLFEATSGIHKVTKQEPWLDKEKLNVVLCIEGAHSFLSGRDRPWVRGGIRKQEYLNRVEDIFSKHSVFYLTLAHIAPNGIFNHAFAGKLLDIKERSKFLPRNLDSRGITDLGFELIDKCIAHNVHPDVKHLSYRGRVALYEYLEAKKKANQPYVAPIATHMGVWGIPESKIEQAFTQGASFITYRYLDEGGEEHLLVECTSQARVFSTNKVAYYPRTISLLDEDIIRIARLGGLIGIIMDQRVLGIGRVNRMEDDIMTMDDFKWLCSRNNINPFDYLIGNDDSEVRRNSSKLNPPPRVKWPKKSPNNKEDRTGPPNSTKAKKHLVQFCRTVLYIMDVLRKNNIRNPSKYICLGSDYDGLVDAVNCCKTFEDLPDFKERVEDYMNKNVRGFKTKYGKPVDKFVHGLFYNNVVQYFGFKRKPIRP